MNQLFTNLFNQSATSVDPGKFLLSLGVTLLLGLFSAWVYQYKTIYTKQFVITLATLPALISLVIFLVNGSLGTSVAVMGTFSLIRFRSAPGGPKELLAIFMAMSIGIATGMGYLALAVVFTLLMSAVSFLFETLDFGQMKHSMRQITIVIPENLDYDSIFDDIFGQATNHYELAQVKTSDMGSLFKLKYLVQLNGKVGEKELMDKLRIRNGNLPITISRSITKENEL